MKQKLEMDKRRQSLLNKISFASLDWSDVTLHGGLRIKVCRPAKVDGVFVPVTAKETRDFARAFVVYPLTRAVCDQIFNKARFVNYRWQPDGYDFDKSSVYLNSKIYDGIKTFGAHKLWVLSCKSRSTNYGFYEYTGSPSSTGGGTHLKGGYNLKQTLGARHNENHWDYSQLLQLMYASEPLQVGGKSYSLSMALLEGLPAVWDEARKLKQTDLP